MEYVFLCFQGVLQLNNNFKKQTVHPFYIFFLLFSCSMIGEVFCADFNITVGQNISSSSQEMGELLKQHKALCWMLFIVAKAKVLWHRQELLATFHLLLCCIAEVIRSTPTFLLLPPFGKLHHTYTKGSCVLCVLFYYSQYNCVLCVLFCKCSLDYLV